MSLKFKDIPIDSNDDIYLSNRVSIKRRPSIPRSSSGTKITPVKSSSLQRTVIDKHKTHDDTKLSLHQSSSPSSVSSIDREHLFDTKFEFEYPDKKHNEEKDDQNIPHSHIGSLPYASPELLESSPPPLGPSADIWAFGVLLYTMIAGKLPFQHQYEPRLRAMISAGKYDVESLKVAAKNDLNLINAVKGCLITDLTKRVSLDEVAYLINHSGF
jgi:protein-serine/threonine kinase